MMIADLISTRLIGLGGAGIEHVGHLLVGGRSVGGALLIDNRISESIKVTQQFSERVTFLNLTSNLPQVQQILTEGAGADVHSSVGQARLRASASWRIRPSPVYSSLPLGAASYRALCAMIADSRWMDVKSQLEATLNDAREVVVVSSASGGTGSSLLTRIVRSIHEISSDIQIRVIVLINSPAGRSLSCQQIANEFATLSECRSLLRRADNDRLLIHCVDVNQADLLRNLNWYSSNELFQVQGDDWTHPFTGIDQTLEISSENLLSALNSKGWNSGNSCWAWARCESIENTSGRSEDEIRKIMLGYIIAICNRKLIKSHDDSHSYVLVDRHERQHPIHMFRPHLTYNDILPSLIEASSFLPRGASQKTGDGIANNWVDALIDWAESCSLRSLALLGMKSFSDPIGYNTHYPGFVAPEYLNAEGQVDVIGFIRRQISLVQDLESRLYTGDEGIGGDGRPFPPEILFRDIAPRYLEVLSIALSDLGGVPEEQTDLVVEKDLEGQSRNLDLSIRLSSAKRSMKPFWFVRYAVPAALALVSVFLFLLSVNSSIAGRQVWSESATVVAGLMGGLAVCLGAIALISSIQNSSVMTQRADKLFSSSNNVVEAIGMFDVALKKAFYTPNQAADYLDPWSHPSVKLAVLILGKRLVTALDDGLFGLLEERDRTFRQNSERLSDSRSLQVFVLLDDLVRICPDVLSLDVAQRGKPASPESIRELALNIRKEIDGLSYRDVSRSLRGGRLSAAE